jgi:hypothetical protein
MTVPERTVPDGIVPDGTVANRTVPEKYSPAQLAIYLLQFASSGVNKAATSISLMRGF